MTFFQSTLYYTTLVGFIGAAILLILLVLIQKGRGGGLAGAFGGGGGSTAFGAKTGDVLTWATSILFGIFVFTAVAQTLIVNHQYGASSTPVAMNAAATPDVTPPPVDPTPIQAGPTTVPSGSTTAPTTQSATTTAGIPTSQPSTGSGPLLSMPALPEGFQTTPTTQQTGVLGLPSFGGRPSTPTGPTGLPAIKLETPTTSGAATKP